MAFTHLHVHTEYSLLDGSNKIKEYVARVKELGMNSAAITDHGVMYGVIDFYKEAKAQGINPILGCEVYVAPNSRFDRETVHGEEQRLQAFAQDDLPDACKPCLWRCADAPFQSDPPLRGECGGK